MNSPTQSRWIRPCTWVYLLLLTLTCVTWAVGHWQLFGTAAALGVLGLALLKGYLIGDWFMGMRKLRGPWRWVIVIWLLVPGALIASAFLMSYQG